MNKKDRKNDVYIYYSGATRQTGEELCKLLGTDGGDKLPKGKKLVIGYGAKTSEDVNFPAGTTVVNHPNKIKTNRNKFKALGILSKHNVPVANFVSAEDVKAALKKGTVKYPVVGRANYHQGGKGFHMVLTDRMLKDAIEGGAQYFQNFIDIEDEYRLHVFFGKVIHAQKKAPRENMAEAFVEQHADKVKQTADQAGVKLDEKTLKYVLEQTGQRVVEKPDTMIRSNTRGWKFKVMDAKKIHADLVSIAIDAVKAMGLDFGAVDCCKTTDGKYLVLEINSGAGLQETSLTAYVEAFDKKIDELMDDKLKKKVSDEKAKPSAATPPASTKEVKNVLRERLSVLGSLLDAADSDEDVSVVSKLMKKAFGG